MIRYLLSVPLFIVGYLLAMLLNPVVVLFAKPAYGPIDNDNGFGVEPRLPEWLSWFMTADNSLWGDKGWQTKHCPDFKPYWSQVKWLYRNAFQGFSWRVLAYEMTGGETFEIKHSGMGLSADKSRANNAWFYIKASNGAWQLRVIKPWLKLDIGWLLDPFAKRPQAGKALFMLGP